MRASSAIDELFKKNINQIRKEDWAIVIEIAEEPLLLKLIRNGKGNILELFELAAINGNPAIINLIISSQNEIDGKFLEIALKHKQFAVLRKLLDCKIKPVSGLLALEPLFDSCEEAKDILDFLNALDKNKIRYTTPSIFARAVKTQNDDLIDHVIHVAKEQKSPPLEELLSHAITEGKDNLVEKLIKQGAIIGVEHWKLALNNVVIFNLLHNNSKDCHDEVLKYACKQGAIDRTKDLLSFFPWTPKQILDARSTVWESKAENHQRIAKILFFSTMTLNEMSTNDLAALSDDDQTFLLELIAKKNPPELTLPQQIRSEPQLVQTLEYPHASAPPSDVSENQIEGKPYTHASAIKETLTVELKNSSPPSLHTTPNLFSPGLIKERRRQISVMLLNMTPTCLELWKDDLAALAVFNQLNSLCSAEFNPPEGLNSTNLHLNTGNL